MHINPVFVQDMRGIKVGNIAMYNNTVVCIISDIKRDVSPHVIVGTDSNCNIHEGTPDKWKSIMGYSGQLKSFGDKLLDNIISSREIKG